jgi:hypothetical protein
MTNQKKYFEGPSCKKCNEILERTKSKPLDKILNHLTLGSFQFKRFHCWGCLNTRLLSNKDYNSINRQII